MPRILPAVLAASVFLSGCGYVGGPMAPLANIPEAPTDLAARQRGGVIIVHFTVPAMTTERLPIKESLTFDLRVGVWPEGAPVETWAAGATRMPAPTMAGGIATWQIPSAAWTSKEVVLGARVVGANGKASGWSNYWVLPVVPAPDPPHELSSASTADGMRLTWKSSAGHFRVLRKVGDEPQYTVVAPDLTGHEWIDSHSTPGTLSSYLVQSIVPLGNDKEAESELAEAKITPEAPLLPAPPGLVAVPASASIELAWEASGGEVAGYRIYRSIGGGPFEKIADGNSVPAYSDHAVEHGKTYRYAVSALDSAGREGPRSEVREVVMR